VPFPASWSCDCGTLDIEQLVTFWPPEDERADIAKALEADWDVPGGCIDIIDGFHVVVAYRSRRLRLLQTQEPLRLRYPQHLQQYAAHTGPDEMWGSGETTLSGRIPSTAWRQSSHLRCSNTSWRTQRLNLATTAYRYSGRKEQGEAEYGTNEVSS